MNGLPAPRPGTDLIPDGWWETAVVPWADEQTREEPLRDAAAQLAGLETAYQLIGGDTLELTKARRYVEIRWGEVLGPAEHGGDRTKSQKGDLLNKRMERVRFRQLAAPNARPRLIELLRTVTEADRLTRTALLDIAKSYADRHGRGHAKRPPPPSGQYNVLYVDPPWRYDHRPPGLRAIEHHYETAALDELQKIQPPAAASAAIFMWATSPKLNEALALLTAWDFEYVTCAVWIKDRIGMGYWFRQRHELLLVGKRGSHPSPDEDARADSVIEASRGEHSTKPPQVYDLIERMFPDASRVELFARSRRPGWTAWGAQT